MSEQPKAKWHKSKGAKILIGLVITTGIVVTYLLLRKKPQLEVKKFVDDKKSETENGIKETPKYSASELPNGGADCGELKTTFDKLYDYIKCKGDWFAVSKDRVNGKLKEWTSLASNKPASDLLNEKYR